MKHIMSITVFAAVVLAASMAFATDYSGYSTEDLSKMRGTLQNATEQERQQFRTEWQSRLQNMTQEERQLHTGRPENAGQGQGQGDMVRQRERIHQQSATQTGRYGITGGAAASGARGYGAAGGAAARGGKGYGSGGGRRGR